MSGVRDWQMHGVAIKVELATDGDLVDPGRRIEMPFSTGGSGGAPFGWNLFQQGRTLDPSRYNFTTAQGVFSVSRASQPEAYNLNTGIQAQAGMYFPIRAGYRYEIGAQIRQMDGKEASKWGINVNRQRVSDGSWTAFASANGMALQGDWADSAALSYSAATEDTVGRIDLTGGSFGNGVDTNFGTQFQNVYVREYMAEPPAVTWRDITCDVRSLNIRYGREKFTSRYDVATLQIELFNDHGDYAYRLNHPFGLRPGRQVRVTATKDGTTYPMAFHVIDSMTDGYTLDGHVMTQWQCLDPSTVLANVATKATGSTGTSAARVNSLLDQVGYLPRDVVDGVWLMQAIAASGRSVRDEIGVTADSEAGAFFVERDGRMTYRPRSWAQTDDHLTHSNADMLAGPDQEQMPIVDDVPNMDDAPIICVRSLVTDWSMARVINTVTLAAAGSAQFTYEDEASIRAFGPRTYQRLDYVNGWYAGGSPEGAFNVLAGYLMDGWAEPALRVNAVTFAPGLSGKWDFALSVFLNWMIRVWYRNSLNDWGYAVALHVQSVQHTITPDDWEITMAVDQPASFVEVEDNEYGWDYGLWDVALWDQVAEAGALWSSGDKWSTAGDEWGR